MRVARIVVRQLAESGWVEGGAYIPDIHTGFIEIKQDVAVISAAGVDALSVFAGIGYDHRRTIVHVQAIATGLIIRCVWRGTEGRTCGVRKIVRAVSTITQIRAGKDQSGCIAGDRNARAEVGVQQINVVSFSEITGIADSCDAMRKLAQVDNEQTVRCIVRCYVCVRVPTTVACIPELVDLYVAPRG